MAGDWLKFDKSTPDKPEVWQIAESLDIDPDAVVGKLMRLWSWMDDHTQEGNAPSVSRKLLDRIVGVTGFCDCVVEVGWLVDDGVHLSAVNFDRHNGKTAKNRALTAKRVAQHKQKSNDAGNDSLTLDALPREEKRREEKNKDIAPTVSAPKAKRSTQIPDDFEPTDKHRALAASLGVSLPTELPQFIDYHKAKGSAMKDWSAAFNTWIRNAAKFAGKQGANNNTQRKIVDL